MHFQPRPPSGQKSKWLTYSNRDQDRRGHNGLLFALGTWAVGQHIIFQPSNAPSGWRTCWDSSVSFDGFHHISCHQLSRRWRFPKVNPTPREKTREETWDPWARLRGTNATFLENNRIWMHYCASKIKENFDFRTSPFFGGLFPRKKKQAGWVWQPGPGLIRLSRP